MLAGSPELHVRLSEIVATKENGSGYILIKEPSTCKSSSIVALINTLPFTRYDIAVMRGAQSSKLDDLTDGVFPTAIATITITLTLNDHIVTGMGGTYISEQV